MHKYVFILLLSFAISSCSKNDTLDYPNQFAGPDLYNNLSVQERNLLGTWYFAYEIIERDNALDSISTRSIIDYGISGQTDTLRFYSTRFVGFEDYCPLVSPDNLRSKLKTAHIFTGYLSNCFPEYITGWYIENNILKNYWGDPTSNIPVEEFPLVTINVDSLVFKFEYGYNQPHIVSTKPVFYKK